MNKIDNLEMVLDNLSKNIARLRQDSAKRESTNVNIYFKWIHYKTGSSYKGDSELHTDMLLTEYNNERIFQNERQLKHQVPLYTRLNEVYAELLCDDLTAKFALK